ncbi:MAG: hypothetical protein AB1659_11600, partial [Thermodesulfobacteriota bacterium]
MGLTVSSKHRKPRAIVLPMRISSSNQMPGIGLAFHFLIGNILVLNCRLDEMWFGWRVKSIFPEKERLISYCRGDSPEPDIFQLGQQEDIRFWFSGHMENQKILISLTDVEVQKNQTESILFSGQDHYLRFRSRFLDW